MPTPTYDFVIAANRLPLDRIERADGSHEWHRSPGGLVTAMESVMHGREAAWVGWPGVPDEDVATFHDGDLLLAPVPLSAREVEAYYEGYSNASLWPIYHDVIVPATFRRSWGAAYEAVNARFAERCAEVAAQGGTVWVHDYQLQLVPHLLREQRPDLRIGWFNHIPFPPVELFGQLPMRAEILRGLLGADFLGFQGAPDVENFLRACSRYLGARVDGEVVEVPGSDRQVRATTVPISIDAAGQRELAQSESVQARAREIREELGHPRTILLGVDRLDYTKGIRHRLKAFGELVQEGSLPAADTTLVQVASPSRERVEAYRDLKQEIERTVGQINGAYSPIGHATVTYLHRNFPREEMAALYVAADVMLVTPLRDGMNLVAKEYVTSHDEPGALVLSEFTGAARELAQAYSCNPHDIAGLKNTIMTAVEAPAQERVERLRALREQVAEHDVQRWAQTYLSGLQHAPDQPPTGV